MTKNKNLKHSAAVKQASAILYNTDKKKKVGATKKKAATETEQINDYSNGGKNDNSNS
jgi:hypothetical protein